MSKSAGEEELAYQLKCLGIVFTREFRFAPPRRWRFDFVLGDETADGVWSSRVPKWAIEVEGGSFSGGHRRGREADKDTEKSNAAVMTGWRVLRFTPYQIETGEAIETIEAALDHPSTRRTQDA